MRTPLIVRLAAISASAAITLALLQSVALLGHPRLVADAQLARTGSSAAPATGADIDDMLDYRTYSPAGAALAATAAASWRRSDVQRVRAPADTAYLPALFVEEERAAPIEPLPPQF